MADNKVNFLRGTSSEYEAATKDNDTFYYTTDDGKLYLGNKEITGGNITVDDALSDTSENPVQNKVINAALSSKAALSDIPTTLPANGGNADTVNNHTVESDVPADAEFTDTVYTHPTYTARTGVPTANQTPAFGGSFSVSQPVSDATGHITAMNSRSIKIPSTPASASVAGLITTGAQTLAGDKTFNGKIIPNGASDVATAQARKISAGTDDLTAGTSALETGTIYLVYE